MWERCTKCLVLAPGLERACVLAPATVLAAAVREWAMSRRVRASHLVASAA